MKSGMNGTITTFVNLNTILLLASLTLFRYFLPEGVGTIDFKHPYSLEDLEEVNNELHSPDDSNESLIYQEYLSYVNQTIGIAEQNSRMDAVELYHRLLRVVR